MSASTVISDSTISGLHSVVTRDSARVRSILDRVAAAGIQLFGGMNRRIEPEVAVIGEIRGDELVLKTDSFERKKPSPTVNLRFSLDGSTYFFRARRVESAEDGSLIVQLPNAIYDFERRDHDREAPRPERGDPARLTISSRGSRMEAIVEDIGPSGFGVRVRSGQGLDDGMAVELEGTGVGRTAWVRHVVPGDGGWVRLGLAVHQDREPINVERPNSVMPGGARARVRNNVRIAARSVGLSVSRALRKVRRSRVEPEIVSFSDRDGRNIVGILDSWGTGSPIAVIIPPAWGRTKETLLPLARTIVATFKRAGMPVVVLRFDGVNKRGESSKDPGCEKSGHEQHRFTFSQGFVDIEACFDYAAGLNPRPLKTALVTFSAASIDGRTAIARDTSDRVHAWIPVVGSADLQDLMRTVSGGVDFVGGCARGLKFGLQEILGVEVDMDRAAEDALKNKLAYIEDSRRDFGSIDIPITWYHGRFDAWMDLKRIRDVMSVGNVEARRVVEVPTGHQLKSSAEALQVFQAISVEIARLTTGRDVVPDMPSFVDLADRQQAERSRLATRAHDLRSFWHDYLVGPEETVGIELMTATSAYKSLMRLQLELLAPAPGQTILDLGSGVSAFPIALGEEARPARVRVLEVDLVSAALRRGRSKVSSGTSCDFIEADIGASLIPLASSSVDCVLASLLLSYLPNPLAVLREIYRVLRPGGKLVVSSLKLDADISRIYMDGLQEVKSQMSDDATDDDRAQLELATRSFLNDAARLLELEESGDFRFWSPTEFSQLVRDAGFERPSLSHAFGEPAQAIVVAATR